MQLANEQVNMQVHHMEVSCTVLALDQRGISYEERRWIYTHETVRKAMQTAMKMAMKTGAVKTIMNVHVWDRHDRLGDSQRQDMKICSEGSINKSIQYTLVFKPTLSKGKQKDRERQYQIYVIQQWSKYIINIHVIFFIYWVFFFALVFMPTSYRRIYFPFRTKIM